jgi:hypothetical protein
MIIIKTNKIPTKQNIFNLKIWNDNENIKHMWYEFFYIPIIFVITQYHIFYV